MTVDQLDLPDPRITEDPWAIVIEALTYQARGEPIPEDLTDTLSLTACLMTSVALMRQGVSEEKLEDMFDNREWSVRIAYNRDTEELSCEVIWDDGETAVVTAPQPGAPA